MISVYEGQKKQERFFFSRETYTKDIVIDLIIIKLFEICHVDYIETREQSVSAFERDN